ncbi:B12-binding domain-containing radical SAM protein [Kibdelosporangium persicum]|uniref:B12-binding domain-containing protein n=1 Tax=Kibdelosporangium persicum TaxID=2698649 RepID=A0ABX2FGX7_9PSEU|nr:radical SAM protein [Kibdelosporangium persicum]NRN70643.1 B12-binding domain-containing protein [Kibdelosporangium persicum]
MRVALVLPGSGYRNSSPTSLAGGEHLGLGSIAAYLRQFGHEVTILNFQVEDSVFDAVCTPEEVTERILRYDPEIVGISVTGLTIGQALTVTTAIKQRKPHLHVCWGSHQAASCAEEILRREPYVDTIVAGDGEIPMLRLIEALERGEPLSTVPGLWYRDVDESAGMLPLLQIRLTSNPPEPDIDDLPFPARDTLRELLDRDVAIKDARIYTSRGCPFRCTFCVYPALGYLRRWRDRSADKIVEEIKYLRDEFGIDHFWFSDDNFTLPSRRSRFRALELAEVLREAKLGVTYRVLMRADSVDGQEELMKALADSGLTCAYMGLESGSPRRLEYLDKHTNPDVYRRAVSLVRKYRIGLQVGFIMFDPFTSWEDLRIDADFLQDIEETYLYTNMSQVLYAYPGTPIASQLIEKGLLPSDFNYKSGYREYRYEEPRIGELADVLHKAGDKQWVEVDDFFRRLRMIDVPAVYRNHPEEIADEINAAVETKIMSQNRDGYDFFVRALAAGSEGDLAKVSDLVTDHYRTSARRAREMVSTLQAFPAHIVGRFSAFKYAAFSGPGQEIGVPPRSQAAMSAAPLGVSGDC